MPKMAWSFSTEAQYIRLPEFILSKVICHKSVSNCAEILAAIGGGVWYGHVKF